VINQHKGLRKQEIDSHFNETAFIIYCKTEISWAYQPVNRKHDSLTTVDSNIAINYQVLHGNLVHKQCRRNYVSRVYRAKCPHQWAKTQYKSACRSDKWTCWL